MKLIAKLREWMALRRAKKPRSFVLLMILLFNIVFFFLAAVIISALAPRELQPCGFWYSVFYTVTMILDAGCISYVIEDVGAASVALMICCLLVVFIGSVTFTGAVIGYITNYISGFVESANSGRHPLRVSGHTVILNWNSRASEVVNDLIYSGRRETVVILVPSGKTAVEQETEDRLDGTLEQERRALAEAAEALPLRERRKYIREHRLKNRVTVIVREGDTFSAKNLNDVSIASAKAVIILGSDTGAACGEESRGSTDVVKTLIQVAELTGAETSADNQRIIVETEDDWTLNLVSRIVEHKEKQGKCNIIPVPVNEVLGQILSQFTIMPELNGAYSELFSNKGAAFFSRPVEPEAGENVVAGLMERCEAYIPLTCMQGKNGSSLYYVSAGESDIRMNGEPLPALPEIRLNPAFSLTRRNIVILGHNSKMEDIMRGFDAFRREWNYTDPGLIARYGTEEILNVVVIDSEENLKKHGNYARCPYVNEVAAADVYDREIICDTLNRCIDANEGDTSVMILSDDRAPREEQDAAALTYLIYVQGIVSERLKADPDFDVESVDVVVEILNPRNYDVIRAYSVYNIVISNRYVSKMITQLSEKEEIYTLYRDILTYDDDSCGGFASKELYAKPVKDFFLKLPPACSALELVRGVYRDSPPENKAVVLGIAHKGGRMEMFSGRLRSRQVELGQEDKLIVFSNH